MLYPEPRKISLRDNIAPTGMMILAAASPIQLEGVNASGGTQLAGQLQFYRRAGGP